ncbi:MAG: hypothetical protein P4M13_05455 [Alphaproteobacteria bacterium]|nr:hypothetical protein [Alphaproteobacteria bacterium]
MARGIELQFSALVVDFRDITLSKVIRVAEEKPADERDFVSVSERFIVIPQWAIEGSETGRSDQPTIVKYAFDKARNEVVLFGAASFDVCLPEGEGGRVEIEGTQIKPEDVPSAYRGFVHPSLGLPRLIAVKEARRLAS